MRQNFLDGHVLEVDHAEEGAEADGGGGEGLVGGGLLGENLRHERPVALALHQRHERRLRCRGPQRPEVIGVVVHYRDFVGGYTVPNEESTQQRSNRFLDCVS